MNVLPTSLFCLCIQYITLVHGVQTHCMMSHHNLYCGKTHISPGYLSTIICLLSAFCWLDLKHVHVLGGNVKECIEASSSLCLLMMGWSIDYQIITINYETHNQLQKSPFFLSYQPMQTVLFLAHIAAQNAPFDTISQGACPHTFLRLLHIFVAHQKCSTTV